MKKGKIIEVAVKVIVAALTAFLTAITTTSCMGYGPIYSSNNPRSRPSGDYSNVKEDRHSVSPLFSLD